MLNSKLKEAREIEKLKEKCLDNENKMIKIVAELLHDIKKLKEFEDEEQYKQGLEDEGT